MVDIQGTRERAVYSFASQRAYSPETKKSLLFFTFFLFPWKTPPAGPVFGRLICFVLFPESVECIMFNYIAVRMFAEPLLMFDLGTH